MVKHTIKKLDDSKIEINVEIPWQDFIKFKNTALEKLGKDIDIDGFRKGKIPKEIIIKKIGNNKVLIEALELAVKEIYPKIITEEKIDAIDRPNITVNKLAENNTVEFKAIQIILPKISLPEDYKNIAKKINNAKKINIAVSDKEIEDVLNEIKRNREQLELQKNPGEKKEIKIDDEFAKTLGNFKTLEDLKNQIRENILKEKQQKEIEKKRLEIIEAIISKINISIPDILIENELEKMVRDLEFRISESGLEFEKYLAHINKSTDDLKKEWREQAKKRILSNMVLNEIARKENIKPEKDLVDKEVSEIMKHYPGANEDSARLYVESLFTYDKVYQLLDSQK